MIKTAWLVCMVAMLGCHSGCGVEEPSVPDAAPACKNIFDERCMATNGCGVPGSFCCFRFYDAGPPKSICETYSACVDDICQPLDPHCMHVGDGGVCQF